MKGATQITPNAYQGAAWENNGLIRKPVDEVLKSSKLIGLARDVLRSVRTYDVTDPNMYIFEIGFSLQKVPTGTFQSVARKKSRTAALRHHLGKHVAEKRCDGKNFRLRPCRSDVHFSVASDFEQQWGPACTKYKLGYSPSTTPPVSFKGPTQCVTRTHRLLPYSRTERCVGIAAWPRDAFLKTTGLVVQILELGS